MGLYYYMRARALDMLYKYHTRRSSQMLRYALNAFLLFVFRLVKMECASCMLCNS